MHWPNAWQACTAGRRPAKMEGTEALLSEELKEDETK